MTRLSRFINVIDSKVSDSLEHLIWHRQQEVAVSLFPPRARSTVTLELHRYLRRFKLNKVLRFINSPQFLLDPALRRILAHKEQLLLPL